MRYHYLRAETTGSNQQILEPRAQAPAGEDWLTLDKAGWVPVEELLEACHRHGFTLSRAELNAVVVNNDRARFSFSLDGTRVRPNQGHSIEVELGYEPIAPPEYLFHGTAERFLPSIQAKGIIRGSRHHGYLSPGKDTAVRLF